MNGYCYETAKVKQVANEWNICRNMIYKHIEFAIVSETKNCLKEIPEMVSRNMKSENSGQFIYSIGNRHIVWILNVQN